MVGEPVLPGSIVAAHLEACAAELAGSAEVGTAGELADVLEHLACGQRQLSLALTRLAGVVRGSQVDGALTEVLEAAATAAGYSADAIAESEPVLGALLQTADEDTRL
ncbi:hypothetical protein [Amycolatopsis sp. 195334CR]|uniref:hypothetical protein n=1 Tax=Amycolatopsis sp. 195334CR TaxID=2814588 RepID=UPI001A8F19D5|nr:hypothetical protein [Amycolatopsis sp. 195334CR]MBN6033393.1 hypothetical protein [Amycolatopsis sp. 195334CR]